MAFGDKKNRLQTPFLPDQKLVFTLPMGGKILNGKLIVTGTVTLATTAAGAINGEGGPINLVNRLIVYANPSGGSRYPGGRVVDCGPRSLLRYAIMQHNGKFIGEQAASTLGNGASGTYPIYLSIPLYFADSVLRNSIATALNADPSQYASIQVEVDTADITACFTGWTGTATYNLSLQWVDDRVALDGDTNVVFQEDHVALIGAAQARMLDPAMPQNGAFLQWLIQTQQGAANLLADTILQKVRVEGNPVDYEKYAQDIRQQMLDDEWIDPSQSAAGLYFIDWTDSSLGNSVLANTLQAYFQVLNPSGSNLDDLLIYTRRAVAPLAAS